MIHSLADVQSKNIGKGTTVWQFSVILEKAVIGKNCNINCHTFIENDVCIGDNVTVKSGVYIWDAILIEDDVFIGPHVVFTNDLRPRSKERKPFLKTVIKKGASLGANTVIKPGVTVGRYAMTGIGSIITSDVPDHALVYGNPAKIKGWVGEHGEPLKKINEDTWISDAGEIYITNKDGLIKK